MTMIEIVDELVESLRKLRFGDPVTHVYNPLEYAREPHLDYLKRYARPGCEAVLLGMNPGPFGMAQTGVPFGEVELVRDWMGIKGAVGRPRKEHPKRPIAGFECPRSEVSGARLWGWAKERFGNPDKFFKRFAVLNYCPLVFMEESARNRTPDKLPEAERSFLFEACDEALIKSVKLLKPRWVIGVGAFAEGRAKAALGGQDVKIGRILHPSPASPAANRGWAEAAEKNFKALGLKL